MKLKYQMRGLGIGIMVTALLMGVAMEKGLPLSDAEIRAKALELGMVEREALKLTDLQGESPTPEGASSAGEGEEGALSPGEGEEGASLPGKGDEGASSLGKGEEDSGDSGSVQSAEGATQADSAPDGENLREPEQSGSGSTGSGMQDEGTYADESGSGPAGDAITVVIEYGVTSAHVSELLEEAGLVEDAAAFDTYLCNNGYSRSITAGVYEIQPGTSEEEIIEIITKNR